MFALISPPEFLIYKMTQNKSLYFIFHKNMEKVYQVINCTFHILYKFYSKHFPSSKYLVDYALDLYFSPNIIQVIKSRRLRWVRHVECMGERDACRVLVGKPEGKRPLERYRHRWEIILRWIFRKWDGGWRAWTGLSWLRTGTGGRLL
jgi:hypothetical protein